MSSRSLAFASFGHYIFVRRNIFGSGPSARRTLSLRRIVKRPGIWPALLAVELEQLAAECGQLPVEMKWALFRLRSRSWNAQVDAGYALYLGDRIKG